MAVRKGDLLQGTLDLLVLKVLGARTKSRLRHRDAAASAIR